VCIMGVAWLVACTLLYLAGQVHTCNEAVCASIVSKAHTILKTKILEKIKKGLRFRKVFFLPVISCGYFLYC
jgi:hypothetical protein